MRPDNSWIIDILDNALSGWSTKLQEIWTLVATSPKDFKGGGVWLTIEKVHGAIQAVGLALLVLFFLVGVMRTCGDFTEIKRPEKAFKLLLRFCQSYSSTLM